VERIAHSLKIESEPATPKYDATLVHCYWLSRGGNKMRPALEGFSGSLRTRLTTRSVALLDQNEGAGKIVLLGGNLKGPLYPSAAEIMENELIEKYGISKDRIMVIPDAYGTEEEGEMFMRMARENNWSNVADITFKTHYKSVRRFVPEGTANRLTVDYRSVENISAAFDHHLMTHLVGRIDRSWRFGKTFVGYEAVKAAIMAIPGEKKRIYESQRKTRMTKNNSKFNDLLAHAIDSFKS
jgi:hypothetical protein